MLLYPPSLTTAILFCTMCRSLFWKSFNQYRMLPPTSLHGPRNIYDHITPVLFVLHWVPVYERIKFKILLLTSKALHQQAPTYIQDLEIRYSPPRTLRSSSSLRLNPVIFNMKSYGSRAFAVAAPDLWNSLPDNIRSCDNLSTFKSLLKTYLFREAYCC